MEKSKFYFYNKDIILHDEDKMGTEKRFSSMIISFYTSCKLNNMIHIFNQFWIEKAWHFFILVDSNSITSAIKEEDNGIKNAWIRNIYYFKILLFVGLKLFLELTTIHEREEEISNILDGLNTSQLDSFLSFSPANLILHKIKIEHLVEKDFFPRFSNSIMVNINNNFKQIN